MKRPTVAVSLASPTGPTAGAPRGLAVYGKLRLAESASPARACRKARVLAGACAAALLAAAGAARADDDTEIAGARADGDPVNVHVGVTYGFEARRAAIKREFAGLRPGDTSGVMPVVKDLIYRQSQHRITPRLELGFIDLFQLSGALPIVLGDRREYSFDQRADPCIFPPSPQANCIDASNSTTFTDGILPRTETSIGYDADDPSTGFPLDSQTVFRGVNRKGLDQVHLGLSFIPLNQRLDDTKPTWVVGGELRWSVGKLMKFDPANPDAEDGVARGVHEVRVQTSFSKRTRWAEPFVSFWWQAPIGVRGDTPNDPEGSLYWDVGFGQRNNTPRQHAGTTFGLQARVYERPDQGHEVGIELLGRLNAHFEGLDYSEMWEPFTLAGGPGGPLELTRDPTSASSDKLPHPGLTVIENYMTFAARLGVRGRLGTHAGFLGSFELGHDQPHLITYNDAGTELPACTATRTAGCEAMDDDVVTPGTAEVNPLHVRRVDAPGRRYLVDETTTFTFLVSGVLMW